MLLGPASDFKTLESAMQNPDTAHELIRASQLRVAAGLVYLNNNVGDVLQALVNEALRGRQKVNAAKLLLEITGVKLTGMGARKPREPEGELEEISDAEEFDEILKDAAQILPIGTDRAGTGDH